MAKLAPDPAEPSAQAPSARADSAAQASTAVPRSHALPPDMEGWLSTQQAAEAMGMEKRRFQDHADHYSLPRRKLGVVGTPAYYDPEVIRSAVEARVLRAAKKEAEAAKKQGPPQGAAQGASSEVLPLSLTDRPNLLRQVLAAAQAQTALLDRIVQNIGPMG